MGAFFAMAFGEHEMTRDILDRAAEAVEGTTPGPWHRDCWDILGRAARHGGGTGHICEVSRPNGTDDKYWLPDEADQNARFIAASRQLVPEMAEEIAALRRTVDLIASGQVDAVALARAEKRRWGK